MRWSIINSGLRWAFLFFWLSSVAASWAQTDCAGSKKLLHAQLEKGGGGGELWPFDILHQRIDMDLTVPGQIAATCEVRAVPRIAGQDQLQLHLLALTVDSIEMGSGTLDLDHENELLTIYLGQTLRSEER